MNTNLPIKRDMRKLLCEVQSEYDRQVNAAEYFRKKCEEFNKDDEIKGLQKQLDRTRRLSLHVMDEAEYEADKAFREWHYQNCRNGSTFQYELSGAGIGTLISIICPVCGERKDITSFDNW